MAHFDSIIEQKQKLRRALLNNQTLVDLLVNTGDNMVEFEHAKLGSKSPAAKLVKSHFYLPDTQSLDKNFILMRGRIIHRDTNVVKKTCIVVYVVCNEDQIDLVQGSRADLIANEIDKVLNNGDPLFGFGGIEIGIGEEVQFNDGYSGWEIPFYTHECNREASLLDG